MSYIDGAVLIPDEIIHHFVVVQERKEARMNKKVRNPFVNV